MFEQYVILAVVIFYVLRRISKIISKKKWFIDFIGLIGLGKLVFRAFFMIDYLHRIFAGWIAKNPGQISGRLFYNHFQNYPRAVMLTILALVDFVWFCRMKTTKRELIIISWRSMNPTSQENTSHWGSITAGSSFQNCLKSQWPDAT